MKYKNNGFSFSRSGQYISCCVHLFVLKSSLFVDVLFNKINLLLSKFVLIASHVMASTVSWLPHVFLE